MNDIITPQNIGHSSWITVYIAECYGRYDDWWIRKNVSRRLIENNIQTFSYSNQGKLE